MSGAARPMNTSDFFSDPRWVEVVAQFVLKKLQQKLGDNMQVSAANELIPLISQSSSWSISKNSFGLEFNPYEVAPYSEGYVVIELPYALVRPYLTPFARSILSQNK